MTISSIDSLDQTRMTDSDSTDLSIPLDKVNRLLKTLAAKVLFLERLAIHQEKMIQILKKEVEYKNSIPQKNKLPPISRLLRLTQERSKDRRYHPYEVRSENPSSPNIFDAVSQSLAQRITAFVSLDSSKQEAELVSILSLIKEDHRYFHFVKSLVNDPPDLQAAKFILGLCYAQGIFIDRNDMLAFDWIHKAATQGLGYAQFYLARCYQFGVGTEQNPWLAEGWYQKSLRHGFHRVS